MGNLPTKATPDEKSEASRDKVSWYWKSSPDPWNSNTPAEWERYSDIENEIIEEAYLNKEKEAFIEHYIADLKRMIQINKKHQDKQRPIKRVSNTSVHECLRKERFNLPVLPCKTFSEADWASHYSFMPLFVRTYLKNIGIESDSEPLRRHLLYRDKLSGESIHWNKIVEDAAKGIIKEGTSLGLKVESEWMAKELRRNKAKDLIQVSKCCIMLYSRESFLYKVVNKALREDDQSKVDNLAPFCFLLNLDLVYRSRNDPSLHHKEVVYRGANLTEEMIDSYKELVKDKDKDDYGDRERQFQWPAFTSVSANRKKAESFGNTLFVISLKSSRYSTRGVDISALSAFPDEEETLFPAGNTFYLNNIEHINGKYIIYLISSNYMPYG